MLEFLRFRMCYNPSYFNFCCRRSYKITTLVLNYYVAIVYNCSAYYNYLFFRDIFTNYALSNVFRYYFNGDDAYFELLLLLSEFLFGNFTNFNYVYTFLFFE